MDNLYLNLSLDDRIILAAQYIGREQPIPALLVEALGEDLMSDLIPKGKLNAHQSSSGTDKRAAAT